MTNANIKVTDVFIIDSGKCFGRKYNRSDQCAHDGMAPNRHCVFMLARSLKIADKISEPKYLHALCDVRTSGW